MRNSGRSHFYSICIAASVISAFAPVASQATAADDVVDRVITQWKLRQERWKGLFFDCVGTITISKGALSPFRERDDPMTAPIPSADATFERRLTVWCDFTNNQVRRERDSQIFTIPLDRFCRRFDVYLYDGSQVQIHTPRERNTSDGCVPHAEQPELDLRTSKSNFMAFEPEDRPVFFAFGNYSGNPAALRDHLDASRFSSVSVIRRNDRELQVLRTRSLDASEDNFVELWVDVDHDGAVVHWSANSNGKPTRIVDVEYEEIHDTWMPSHWTMSYLHRDGSLWCSGTTRVEKLHVNPDMTDVVFHMEPIPGMVVYDEALAARWQLRSDGTKQFIDSHPAVAILETPQTRPWYRQKAIVAITCLALIGLAVLWTWRFQKGRGARAG